MSGSELNILERCPRLHRTSLRPGPQGAPTGSLSVKKTPLRPCFVLGIACVMILLRNRVERMLLYICQRHPWLLSAHRRRRAAGGVIQSEPEGLRPRNTGVSGQEKTGVLTQAKRACPLFLCLFAPLGPSIVESDLLYSCLLIQMLIFSRNSPSDTPRNNVLPATWVSLSPVNTLKYTSLHLVPLPVCLPF